MGDSPAAAGHHGHFLPVFGAAVQRRVHGAPILLQCANDHRFVGARQGVVLQLCGQAQVGPVIFRHNEQAGGVLVDAVDNARAKGTADPRKAAAAVVQYGVDHRAVRIAGCGMHHHALGLVDDQHIAVLVDNVQGDVLGHGVDGLRVGQADLQCLAAGDLVILFHRPAVQQHPLFFCQPLGGGAGQLLHPVGQKLVQAAAPVLSSGCQKDGLHPSRPPSPVFPAWAPSPARRRPSFPRQRTAGCPPR